MLLSEYHNGPFRGDLAHVIAAYAPLHDHMPDEVIIQPRTISRANAVMRGWRQEQQLLFAASLFLTVLADQVCYTHFRSSYSRFRELTMHPKWRGDCPGACHYHIHPGVVFRAIGASDGGMRQIAELPFALFPDDLFSTIQLEIQEFVRVHLPEVPPRDFWERCDREVPLEFRMRYIASRSPAV